MQRRQFLRGAAISGAVLAVSPSVSMAAEAKKVKKRSEFAMDFATAQNAVTNGKKAVMSDKVELKVPEIAENGKVVPVKVIVDYPMDKDNYIKSINVLTTKNGNARSANVYLTPANAEAYFSTRIKLGGTQDVVVIAETSKGEFLMAKKSVKVTIGGCGWLNPFFKIKKINT